MNEKCSYLLSLKLICHSDRVTGRAGYCMVFL